MKKLILLTGLTIALITVGCGKTSNPQAEQAATEAAQSWLALIDNGSYAESWEQSAAPFKNSMTAEKWTKMLKPIRGRAGTVKSRTLASREYMTSLPNAPKGEYVIIQFKTDFAEKKGAIETVTPMLENGQWKVSGYYIK
jgi:hypothetical protein